jgi:MFS family permease
VVFGTGASAVNALMPLIARELVGGGPLTYGLLLGAFGAGAVGGALVSTRLRAQLSTEGLVRGASIAFAVGAATAGISSSLVLTLGALLLTGAGWVLALSSFNVTVQMSTPRWVVARALSLYQMAAFGGLAGGSWLWGTVAEAQGLRIALVSAAAVLVSCALIGFVRPLAEVEGHDLGPLRSWTAPDTAVPVDGRTGPVVIAVEWHIAEENIPEFLGAMAERRRIRRRDGAHNWMLLRDLADPRRWVERYHAPTWHDYLRLNTRLTRDDAEVYTVLKRLHQGSWPPEVRRMIEREARPWAPDAGRAARELAAPMTDPTRMS